MQRFEKSYWDFVQTKYEGHYNFADLRSTLSQYLDWIREYVNGKVRVLDVGCSFGYFLRLCDELGWETHGVDISRYAIDTAKVNTKAQLYLHDIENVRKSPFKEDSFDLITMFEVIEHLACPAMALEELNRILKNNGRLVMATPNLNAIERIVLKSLRKEKTWHGLYDRTHIRLFNPFSIRSLVERLDFRILELKTPFRRFPSAINAVLEKTLIGGRIWLVAEKI